MYGHIWIDKMAANERESDPELSADDSDISAELQPERPPPQRKKNSRVLPRTNASFLLNGRRQLALLL